MELSFHFNSTKPMKKKKNNLSKTSINNFELSCKTSSRSLSIPHLNHRFYYGSNLVVLLLFKHFSVVSLRIILKKMKWKNRKKSKEWFLVFSIFMARLESLLLFNLYFYYFFTVRWYKRESTKIFLNYLEVYLSFTAPTGECTNIIIVIRLLAELKSSHDSMTDASSTF